jgi:hypothetical protein
VVCPYIPIISLLHTTNIYLLIGKGHAGARFYPSCHIIFWQGHTHTDTHTRTYTNSFYQPSATLFPDKGTHTHMHTHMRTQANSFYQPSATLFPKKGTQTHRHTHTYAHKQIASISLLPHYFLTRAHTHTHTYTHKYAHRQIYTQTHLQIAIHPNPLLTSSRAAYTC